ncbi:MAG: hypothetical protein QOF76_3779 [Solirubrobacteraceae bacterium]|jgi:4-amino-4-deoxy-L-arabinose transferase-like glycosyltransferase|nr:hypothetical protein [Solirubrobacteraceae bacterium]
MTVVAPLAVPRARVAIPPVLAVVGAAALTLALRVPFVHEPLGVDEGGLAYIARAWHGGAGSSLYGNYWVDRPPLLLALYKLAGTHGAVGIRVLGMAAAAALVALAYALGREIAGARAGAIAAVMTGAMASAAGLLAIFTPAELLASVPAAASLLCLLRSRRGGAAWLIAAGALSVTAVLVKQSFLDAGAAGAAFLVLTTIADRAQAPKRVGAYVLGALLPVAAVALWLAAVHEPAARLTYALFGFRVDGLHTLANAHDSLLARAAHLLSPAARSGLVVALAIMPFGLWRVRRDRLLAVVLGVWLLAGTVGILAGGSYWPHYLIQIVVPLSVVGAAALAAAPRRLAWPAVAVLVAIAVVFNVQRVRLLDAGHNRDGIKAIAHYIRSRSRPGDTQYVLYAKANVDYYTGLPSPYPYAWSLMVRAVPGASQRLAALLESPGRPTWVVGWQKVGQWSLPAHQRIAASLRTDYRLVKRIHGRRIYRSRTPLSRGTVSGGPRARPGTAAAPA